MTRPFEFTGRIRSFKFDFVGIWTMLKSQHNAWVHPFATIVAIGSVIIGVLILGPHVIHWMK